MTGATILADNVQELKNQRDTLKKYQKKVREVMTNPVREYRRVCDIEGYVIIVIGYA